MGGVPLTLTLTPNPDQVGGVPELVRDCIEACAVDTRRELYGAVVLSGGTSLARGLAQRLRSELTELTAATLGGEGGEGGEGGGGGVRVGVIVPPGQQQLVWRGGAVLAELLGPDPTRCAVGRDRRR